MLSALQKYIIKELYQSRRLAPSYFLRFYARRHKNIPVKNDQQTIVARSIERLVERGLCVVKGKKTKEKWFINEVQLTPEGRKRAKEVIKDSQLSFYPTK